MDEILQQYSNTTKNKESSPSSDKKSRGTGLGLDFVAHSINSKNKQDHQLLVNDGNFASEQRATHLEFFRKQVIASAKEDVEIAKALKIAEKQESLDANPTDLIIKKQIDLIEPENKDQGDIKWKDYKDFFSYSYGNCGIAMFFILCCLTSTA